MRITDIRYERLNGTYDTAAGHSVARQVGALDIYPEYRNRKTPVGEVYGEGGPGAAVACSAGAYQ
ncbi:MAG: hypothetical protein R6X16_04950, partial [Anaerolineae bacterium]